jgi:Lar family restriction alleviation protein
MTEQEQVQLLPCPFCGGEADILKAATNICDYWVTCANCGADGPWKDTRAETIAAWNTRHTATAEALEAMREAREALVTAEKVFATYANLHRAKNTKEGNQKAATNTGYSLDMGEAAETLTAAIARIDGEQP